MNGLMGNRNPRNRRIDDLMDINLEKPLPIQDYVDMGIRHIFFNYQSGKLNEIHHSQTYLKSYYPYSFCTALAKFLGYMLDYRRPLCWHSLGQLSAMDYFSERDKII